MRDKAIVLGLTGPSGSGKSEISKLLSDKNQILILDLDHIYHSILNNDLSLRSDIIKYFSKNILSQDNLVDRKKLAKIVFNDKQKLIKLNQITASYIRSYIIKEISLKKYFYKIILLDAPTLIETGLDLICDKILIVSAKREVRLKRVIERDKISLKEAVSRIDSQLTEREYLSVADFVIYNNDGLDYLKQKIDIILKELL